MDQHEAFLHAILEAPEDDAPRLVYADWLDDHGQPARAEFIRLQCALAKLPPDAPQRPEMRQREEELLSLHSWEWAAGFGWRAAGGCHRSRELSFWSWQWRARASNVSNRSSGTRRKSS